MRSMLLIFIALGLASGGCSAPDDPMPAVQRNPYGFSSDDLRGALGEQLQGVADREVLKSRPNPYGFRPEDLEFASAERDLAAARRSALADMLQQGRYNNLGNYVQSPSAIPEGVTYWTSVQEDIRGSALPYWAVEREGAARDSSDLRISFCDDMRASLERKDRLAELIVSDLHGDQNIHNGYEEPAADLAGRKLAVQDSTFVYYSNLLTKLEVGIALDLLDWGRARRFVVSPADVPIESAYWQEQRTRLRREDRPFWELEVARSVGAGNLEWTELCEGMRSSVNRRDSLATRVLLDLVRDEELGFDPSSQTLDEVVVRKRALVDLRIRTAAESADMLRRGMALAIRG